ncbi:tRNA-uridine aminocarboxypropyltransferase [Vibrio anguillarum]|uniref:tRNA-uridine aminocarboxypropyltransferase n=1 Tax=Vibrio anguillarum TaxID=55601 RepID=UPI00097E3394|nr:tRNA-uridine aminocarboxypropyltransferase [Vibrio anguillarum]MBT2955927.1 DTW domain-containing protein [Vibrio anguillarum]
MRIHAFNHLFQHRLALSTKPFQARGAKVERCAYCQVATQYCLCGHQPDMDTDIAVLLLVSENEVFKPSNTGRLIADVIKETYVYQWNRTEPHAEMLALLNNPAYQPVVIFPEEYVDEKPRVMQSPPSAHDKHKPLLILLDGSWREARRMFRKSPYLDALPVMSIAPKSVSQYMMRKSDNEQHLSTAEVASLVLVEVGEHQASLLLSQWFEVFRESYLLSKTRLKHDLSRPVLKRFIDQQQSET